MTIPNILLGIAMHGLAAMSSCEIHISFKQVTALIPGDHPVEVIEIMLQAFEICYNQRCGEEGQDELLEWFSELLSLPHEMNTSDSQSKSSQRCKSASQKPCLPPLPKSLSPLLEQFPSCKMHVPLSESELLLAFVQEVTHLPLFNEQDTAS